MKIIYRIIMSLFMQNRILCSELGFSSMFHLKNIDSYQISVFVSGPLTIDFAKETPLILKIPKSIYYLQYFDEENCFLSSTNLIKDSSLITLFTTDSNDLKLLINSVVKLTPLRPRPKFFIILLNPTSNFNRIRTILKYAWENKIFDFTVAEVDHHKSFTKIHCYNDFQQIFVSKEIDDKGDMWPNKFENVENYTMKIGLGKNMNKYYTDTQGFLFARDKTQFLVSFIVKAMNFRVEYVEIDQKCLSEYLHAQKRYLWFENTDANLLDHDIVVTDNVTNLVVTHSGKKCRAVVAVVPKLYKSTFRVPLKMFVLLLIIPVIILIFVFAVKVLKITNEFDGIFDITCILLGQSIISSLKKTTSRIIYMTFIIFFVYISNEFYSGILDITLNEEEVEFDSYEDLDKSGLPIYTPIQSIDYIYSANNSPFFQSLKKKTKRLENCLTELKKTRCHICLEWEYDATTFLKDGYSLDESIFMKIVEPPFFCDDLFFGFEYASPYLKIFSTINQRVIESGIMQIEYFRNNLTRFSNFDVKPDDEKNIINQLMFILAIGNIVAVIMFVIEYCTNCANLKT